MNIKISKPYLQIIQALAEESFPNECCGFLLGNSNGTSREVVSTLPVENEREESAQHNRYLITPQRYLASERFARDKGLDIIGFYHSHPDAEARPSVYDTEHAWPWYSYIIVSVRDGSAAETTAWVMKEDRSGFNQENLLIL
jgi:proteasome lid subunit RPN8/RPN11